MTERKREEAPLTPDTATERHPESWHLFMQTIHEMQTKPTRPGIGDTEQARRSWVERQTIYGPSLSQAMRCDLPD